MSRPMEIEVDPIRAWMAAELHLAAVRLAPTDYPMAIGAGMVWIATVPDTLLRQFMGALIDDANRPDWYQHAIQLLYDFGWQGALREYGELLDPDKPDRGPDWLDEHADLRAEWVAGLTNRFSMRPPAPSTLS